LGITGEARDEPGYDHFNEHRPAASGRAPSGQRSSNIEGDR
jgi:hypothetical protein